MTVPTDGPDGWYRPQSAAHFMELGLVAPDYLYLCNETGLPGSVNLANVIGASLPLVATGTGHLYQQPVPGWTAPFIGLDGASLGQSWQTTSALLDLASGQSIAMVAYASMAIQPAGTVSTSRLMGFGVNNGLAFTNANGTIPGGLRPIINSSASTTPPNGPGTVDESGIASVRQFVLYRNAGVNLSGATSDRSASLTTHNESALAGDIKGIGPFVSVVPPTARICLLAIYLSEKAEQQWEHVLWVLRGQTSNIPHYDAYKTKVRAARKVQVIKNSVTIAGDIMWKPRLWTSFRTAPYQAGAAPSTAVAVNSTTSTSGASALPGIPPSTTVQRIAAVSNVDNATPRPPFMVLIADRLSHQGGLSGTTVGTTQTTNLPTAPLTRYTDGVGVMAALQVNTSIGNGVVLAQCSYTNQAGTAGRTSPQFLLMGMQRTAAMCLMPLQEGDYGVRSVESVTLLDNGVCVSKISGGGFDSTDNAAYSNEGFAGDGYIELILGPFINGRVGLSVTPALGAATIDYCFDYNGDHTITPFENNSQPVGSRFPVQHGDVIRVQRVGTVVSYYRNGLLIHTSAVSSTGTLKANVVVTGVGSGFSNIKMYDAGVNVPLTWNHTNTGVANGTGTAGDFGVGLFKILDVVPVAPTSRGRWHIDALMHRGGYMPQVQNSAHLEMLGVLAGTQLSNFLTPGATAFALHLIAESANESWATTLSVVLLRRR